MPTNSLEGHHKDAKILVFYITDFLFLQDCVRLPLLLPLILLLLLVIS
jgi:hypothetical protein